MIWIPKSLKSDCKCVPENQSDHSGFLCSRNLIVLRWSSPPRVCSLSVSGSQLRIPRISGGPTTDQRLLAAAADRRSVVGSEWGIAGWEQRWWHFFSAKASPWLWPWWRLTFPGRTATPWSSTTRAAQQSVRFHPCIICLDWQFTVNHHPIRSFRDRLLNVRSLLYPAHVTKHVLQTSLQSLDNTIAQFATQSFIKS